MTTTTLESKTETRTDRIKNEIIREANRLERDWFGSFGHYNKRLPKNVEQAVAMRFLVNSTPPDVAQIILEAIAATRGNEL